MRVRYISSQYVCIFGVDIENGWFQFINKFLFLLVVKYPTTKTLGNVFKKEINVIGCKRIEQPRLWEMLFKKGINVIGCKKI